MKKIFILSLYLLLVDFLLSQTINFRDKKSLTSLLCSKTWIRYDITDDSTFSDRITDTIKFYTNGTFYKSASPKEDSAHIFLPPVILVGKWNFGSTGKTSSHDTASSYIDINIERTRGDILIEDKFELFDGYKIKGTKLGKVSGNLDCPFIAYIDYVNKLTSCKRQIWQAPRKFLKVHSH